MRYQSNEKGAVRSHDPLVRALEACTAEELTLLLVMLSAVAKAAPVKAAPTGEEAAP